MVVVVVPAPLVLETLEVDTVDEIGSDSESGCRVPGDEEDASRMGFG